jgi:predicted N-acetyltransferase YhbS
MNLLKYKNQNINDIQQLFTQIFSDSEGKSEGLLIGNLVHNFLTKTDPKDLNVYLAFENDKLIGSIVFSRFRFEKSKKEAFLLAPVAVHTDYHGKGIGQKLIQFGHDDLKKNGVEIVITYGDINFYSKTGYQTITEEIIKAPLKLKYPEGWLAQSFEGDKIEPIEENSYCVEEINNPVYW